MELSSTPSSLGVVTTEDTVFEHNFCNIIIAAENRDKMPFGNRIKESHYDLIFQFCCGGTSFSSWKWNHVAHL